MLLRPRRTRLRPRRILYLSQRGYWSRFERRLLAKDVKAMKQNTFSVIVLSFLVSFALIFSGGCGGGSTSSLTETQSSSSNVQSYVAASEMVSVMQTEKFSQMFNELGEQGVFERIGDWYLMYNVSEDIQAKILGQLSGEARESMVRSFYSADLVAEKYNSGEVVAIAYPDEAIINKVLEAAGL